MKLFKLTRTDSVSYDEFDSVIVAAKDAIDAVTIHPTGDDIHVTNGVWMSTYTNGGEYPHDSHSWPLYKDVNTLIVQLLGTTSKEIKRGVILASFIAG